jgi:hypothetical protein
MLAMGLETVFVHTAASRTHLSIAAYTVEIRPWWLPELLIAMAVVGAAMMVCGIRVLR